MANRIKELRKKAGLTLQGLADLVGTSNQQISHLEKGRRGLTVEWMERIAPALGVAPADLLAERGNVRPAPINGKDPDEMVWLDSFTHLMAWLQREGIRLEPSRMTPLLRAVRQTALALRAKGQRLDEDTMDTLSPILRQLVDQIARGQQEQNAAP